MAAKKKKSKRNPTGALVVNPRSNRKRNKAKSRAKPRARRSISLKHVFAAVGGLKKRTNRKRRPAKSNRRHNQTYVVTNPLVTNPLLANRRHKKKSNRRKRAPRMMVFNPLVTNPLLANRRHKKKSNRRHNRRHNPNGIAGMLSRFPVLGPILAASFTVIGGALGGAVGAVPLYYGVKPVYGKLPNWLKPYAFALAGILFAGVAQVLVPKFRFKTPLVFGLAFGGGAIDGFRFLTARMGALSGDDGMGDPDETGDLEGDDGMGNAGDVRPAEYSDADLLDAQYSDGDISADEAQWAGYGRAAFRKRFWRPVKGEKPSHEGASKYAGRPGVRWAWLVYWVGFDQFVAITKLPEAKRRDVIHRARHAAMQTARQALTVAPDTSVTSAEQAGLLAVQ